jgi:hypothetical protein
MVKLSQSYLPPPPPRPCITPTFPQAIPHFFDEYADRYALFRAISAEYSGLSADEFDPIRIIQFFHLLASANALPDGDYIELGTYGGLTLKVIHKLMDQNRTLYSLDTFEGFDQRDIAVEKTKYVYDQELEWFSRPSIENVARYVGDGTPPKNLKIIKGWFPESFKGLEQIRWRFVHIDFDLYQPIKEALNIFWDALVPGGFIVVHDYGCYSFRAARMAVDEFCKSVGVMPTEMPDRWGSAVLRKPTALQNGIATGARREQDSAGLAEMPARAKQARTDTVEFWRGEADRVREQAIVDAARVDKEWRTRLARYQEESARFDTECQARVAKVQQEMRLRPRALRFFRKVGRSLLPKTGLARPQ